MARLDLQAVESLRRGDPIDEVLSLDVDLDVLYQIQVCLTTVDLQGGRHQNSG